MLETPNWFSVSSLLWVSLHHLAVSVPGRLRLYLVIFLSHTVQGT